MAGNIKNYFVDLSNMQDVNNDDISSVVVPCLQMALTTTSISLLKYFSLLLSPFELKNL